MYLQSNIKKVGTKTYRSLLLVHNYREGAKIKHNVLANLTAWPSSLVEGIRSLIKGETLTRIEDLPRKAGKNFGGLFVLKELAKTLFIEKILGTSKKGKLAMLLVLGRILTQGSRRHLTFWKEGAIEEVLGVSSFDEDDLYETLDWLEQHQAEMEEKWFKRRFHNQPVTLFLYDVTSSYLEGQHNELADYGYNRDKKKGKKQIVIGLLTHPDGSPISVEVFCGNTADVSTVPNQIRKMAKRFGVLEVTLVGDRGMIKKIPMEALKKRGWHYITAITKPQIERLIQKGVFQLRLFDDQLVEVVDGGVRYFLRRNPKRADEIRENRRDKIQKIASLCQRLNEYLNAHSKASIESAMNKLNQKISRLQLKEMITTHVTDRSLALSTDECVLEQVSLLDGCYVIKTDLSPDKMKAEEVHCVYKGLSEVEWAFRTLKTGLLEIRPLYHRKANRTRACAFVAMLAYSITHALWQKTSHIGIPLDSILSSLDQIQTQEMKIADQWIPLLPTHLRNDQAVGSGSS